MVTSTQRPTAELAEVTPARDRRIACDDAEHPALAPVLEAEAANDDSDFDRALHALEDVYTLTRTSPALRLRALLAESWARMYKGDLAGADELLQFARELADHPRFGELERAEVMYRLGCCRLQSGKVGNATELFTIALELCQAATTDCTRLRANVLQWRARCWLRQHLPEMARHDVELALELVDGLDAPRTVAHAFLQASVVAERQSHWLVARLYAEQALAGYEQVGDSTNAQIALNNLGGINFLLDNDDKAVACLDRALDLALELGDEIGAAYTVSTLGRVALERGDTDAAERHATHALELLDGADAHLAEYGSALLILGRARLQQERYDEAESLFRRADGAFEQVSSVGHRAEAWVAEGDLARARGDLDAAASRYRKAALALQDIHL